MLGVLEFIESESRAPVLEERQMKQLKPFITSWILFQFWKERFGYPRRSRNRTETTAAIPNENLMELPDSKYING